MRAVRPGALVLKALQETALAYLRRDGDAIPFWRMAQTPVAELETRAQSLGVGNPISTMSMTGGGSLPGEEFPSAGIEIEGDVSKELRNAQVPVIARVRDQSTILDLRTVHPDDDAAVAKAIASAI